MGGGLTYLFAYGICCVPVFIAIAIAFGLFVFRRKAARKPNVRVISMPTKSEPGPDA